MYKIQFDKPAHVHFIGIGGISMSGLAQILIAEGFTVSGSDSQETELTRELAGMGADVAIGQSADNIKEGIDLVVYTAAIHEDNPEYAEAKRQGIPMMSRAALLGQIMDNYPQSIAVSGTHGKTTTTSMITHILLQADTDPTVSIGGMLDRIGGNIRVGASDLFLTEACEYTNSFLEFYPRYSIILNVEEDHLDFFSGIEDIIRSFRTFAGQTAKGGSVIVNGDMEHFEAVTKGLEEEVISFGLDPSNDYSARDIVFDENGDPTYTLLIKGVPHGEVSLHVKGRHNVVNSLAAIACSLKIGLPMETILRGLASFGGTHRRFEKLGMIGDVTVIDDYAHHPTEIRATIEAAGEFPHDDIWVIFQPHTYTRTKALLHEFVDVLSGCDHVVLADIYAAREPDTGEISSEDLYRLLLEKGTDAYYFPSFEEIGDFVKEKASGRDIIMTVGAGNVVEIGEYILKRS